MKSFDKLIWVMARLRSPKGCPWDRKQTHAMLLKYLYQEADEVKNAIRKKDFENLKEELGDILLQVVFHARIAEEKGLFNIDDVVHQLNRKLTLRHPHVFGYTREHRKLLGKKKLLTAKDVLDSWKDLKKISSRRRPRRL